MKRFFTVILLLVVFSGISYGSDVTNDNLYAIYECTGGEIFFDHYRDEYMNKNDLAFTFHYDKGSKWVGLGYSEGNEITLFDLADLDSEENDDEEAKKYLILTCSDPDENGTFETITVKGSKAFGKRFDGKYKAHHGHM